MASHMRMPEARTLNSDSEYTFFAGTNRLFGILLLAAALLAQTFASGRLAVAPAVWLAPFLLLVFVGQMCVYFASSPHVTGQAMAVDGGFSL
jgi:hypothetical protein